MRSKTHHDVIPYVIASVCRFWASWPFRLGLSIETAYDMVVVYICILCIYTSITTQMRFFRAGKMHLPGFPTDGSWTLSVLRNLRLYQAFLCPGLRVFVDNFTGTEQHFFLNSADVATLAIAHSRAAPNVSRTGIKNKCNQVHGCVHCMSFLKGGTRCVCGSCGTHMRQNQMFFFHSCSLRVQITRAQHRECPPWRGQASREPPRTSTVWCPHERTISFLGRSLTNTSSASHPKPRNKTYGCRAIWDQVDDQVRRSLESPALCKRNMAPSRHATSNAARLFAAEGFSRERTLGDVNRIEGQLSIHPSVDR